MSRSARRTGTGLLTAAVAGLVLGGVGSGIASATPLTATTHHLLVSAGAGSGVAYAQVSGLMTTRLSWTGQPQRVTVTEVGTTVAQPRSLATDVQVSMTWEFDGPYATVRVTRWPTMAAGVVRSVTGSSGRFMIVLTKDCAFPVPGNARCEIRFGAANALHVTFGGGTPTVVLATQTSTSLWPAGPGGQPGMTLTANPISSKPM